ncbi:MAG: hypothetical protein LBO75_02305 [Bifidobacteriaceae bacterium]|jgi:Zn-dependent protease|nr:hypothetical protein [Bifidobacteriaceae bacterium]
MFDPRQGEAAARQLLAHPNIDPADLPTIARAFPALAPAVAAHPALISAAALLWVTKPHGTWEIIFTAVGVATLLAWHALAPRLLRSGRAVAHRSFPMGSLLTVGLAPLGLGFTPPAPLAVGDEDPVAVRRAGIAATGLATALFIAVAALTAAPAARAVAVAGILVVSSAMIPFPPLDGSRINAKRWAEIAITIVLMVASAAVALLIV